MPTLIFFYIQVSLLLWSDFIYCHAWNSDEVFYCSHSCTCILTCKPSQRENKLLFRQGSNSSPRWRAIALCVASPSCLNWQCSTGLRLIHMDLMQIKCLPMKINWDGTGNEFYRYVYLLLVGHIFKVQFRDHFLLILSGFSYV